MKFTQLIEQHLTIINEEEPPMDPAAAPPEGAPPEGAPAEAPVETPDSALPDEDAGQDDTVVMRVNLVEMIRKALVMEYDHVSDIDKAKLGKIVDTENLDQMQDLVSRIVNNDYPHVGEV